MQWDTSNHDWLEGRGEAVRYLVRMIDDATSRSGGRFVQHDGTRENMGVLWEYVERKGRMVDLYTDRAAMFTVTPRAGESVQQTPGGGPADADRPGAARAGNRLDSGVLAASQRDAWSEASEPIRTVWSSNCGWPR